METYLELRLTNTTKKNIPSGVSLKWGLGKVRLTNDHVKVEGKYVPSGES